MPDILSFFDFVKSAPQDRVKAEAVVLDSIGLSLSAIQLTGVETEICLVLDKAQAKADSSIKTGLVIECSDDGQKWEEFARSYVSGELVQDGLRWLDFHHLAILLDAEKTKALAGKWVRGLALTNKSSVSTSISMWAK